MIANPSKSEYDCFEQGELNEIEAESIGWIPLEDGQGNRMNLIQDRRGVRGRNLKYRR